MCIFLKHNLKCDANLMIDDKIFGDCTSGASRETYYNLDNMKYLLSSNLDLLLNDYQKAQIKEFASFKSKKQQLIENPNQGETRLAIVEELQPTTETQGKTVEQQFFYWTYALGFVILCALPLLIEVVSVLLVFGIVNGCKRSFRTARGNAKLWLVSPVLLISFVFIEWFKVSKMEIFNRKRSLEMDADNTRTFVYK